ncbi:MAG TPA: PorP/SprF family type IX secretion system membrane protein [Ohtaekwangia sp.]
MKRPLLLLAFGLLTFAVQAQDVPLFTQKLTNSFLYNPSVAGNTFGSITFSHRKMWSGVQDAPNTNLLSVHTPFGQHKFGLGLNFYSDNIGITQNIYLSSAFAYHIKINDNRMLSFGVSGEYSNLKLDPTKADVIDPNDPLLRSTSSQSHLDFSFGTSYKSKYVSLGASANKISSLLGIADSTDQFPAFYSGFLQFTIPFADERHLLEPMVTYRSFASGEPQFDAGLYYTYNDFAILGSSYRSGGALNLTAALKFNKRILVGYSRDMYTSDVNKGVGATNEITIRLDFRNESYYTKARNARAINTNALAIRRKTLSMYQAKGRPMQKSSRYKKKIKKNSFMSPNHRMNASKKLMTVKSKRKPGYKRRR